MGKKIFNNFDFKFINALVKYINLNFPNKRKSKYSNHYYVKNIFYVLKTGIQWNYLICESHFTSVYKKFILWTKNNVFNNFFKNNVDLYLTYKLINNDYLKDVYIDSSHIKNINGCDTIGHNHYDRFRNSTKCHIIVDENIIPITYSFTSGNKNDASQIKILIDNLSKYRTDNRRSINVIGDKGYISKNLYEHYKNKNLFLITPHKKNQKNKINYGYKKFKLYDRYKVEFLFMKLDKFRRILLRFEKKVCNFISFHLIAFSYIILKFLNS